MMFLARKASFFPRFPAISSWGGRYLFQVPGILLVLLLILLPLTAEADRAQARRLYLNTNGDLALVGNMLLHCSGSGTSCTNAQNGTGNVSNNDFNPMAWVNADTAAGLTNSSSANLNMPAGSTVEWAGLYWGSKYTGSYSATTHGRISLRRPGAAGYQVISATTADTNASNGSAYQAFADVTAQVQAGGAGTYWAGGLTGTTASNSFAGWMLVVVYSNPSLPFRNFAVYDGFGYISNATVTLTPTGFLTPFSGPVVSRLGVLLWDGDRGGANANERLLLNNTSITNAVNPTGDVWNGTISDLGANVTSRNPSYQNALGVDIDRFNVPSGVIPNGATSATIGIQSPGTSEVFWFGVATFMTDIYVPVVIPNVVKTSEDMSPATPLLRGDTLRWHVVMSNSGYDSATNLSATDIIPPYLTYVPGSLVIGSGADAGSKSDGAGDDQADFGSNTVTFRLGSGANATQGGTLAYGQSTSFYFDTTVNNDTPAGAVLSNQVQIQYNSQTLPATTFAASSAAATTTVMGPPGIAKTFSPSVIDSGQNAVLSVTVSNPAGNPQGLTGVAFTDTYPAGLANTGNPNPQVTCTPGSTAGTLSGGTSGGNTIGMSGASLAAGGSCVVTVNVSATTVGTYPNITGIVSSTNGGNGGTASATLSVGKPGITKAFSPAAILSGANSTMTLTLQNVTAVPLSGVAFSDALTNMQVANPSGVVGNCNGGTVTATPGSTSISLSGGALPASASCVLSVNVTSTTPGVLPNTTTGVSSTQSGSAGNPSNTAELTVIAPPVLAKSFAMPSVRTNSPVQMTLTVSNPNPTTTITGVAFSDGVSPLYPSGMSNSSPANASLSCTAGSSATLSGGGDGAGSVSLSGGTLAPGGSCVITLNVQSSSTATSPPKINTTSQVTSTNAGTGSAATANLIVVNRLSATKAFTTPIAYNSPSAPTYSTMTISLSETGSGSVTGAGFTDVFPGGLYVSSPVNTTNSCGGTLEGRTGNGAWGSVTAGNTSLRLSGGTINTSCAITVRVTSDDSGFYTNTIDSIYSNDGGDFGPVSGTLNVLGPPQVSKSFTSDSIANGGSSTLAITISNPTTATVAMTGVTVDDIFPTSPSAMLTASGTATRTCSNPSGDPGAATFVARNSGNTGWDSSMANNRAGVRVTGLTLQPNQTCIFSISVDTAGVGNHENTTSAVTSGNGGTGNTATATLSVGQIDVTKTLCTATVNDAIAANSSCTMTLTFTNSSGASRNVVMIDDFPGQTAASGAFSLFNTTLGGSCSATGRTLNGYTGSSNRDPNPALWATAATGNTGIRLAVTVPTGGCTVTVNVRSTETLTNVIQAGQLTATGGYSNGAATSATLFIALPLTVQKSFGVASIPLNGTASMTISLTNLNAVSASSVAFTDQFPTTPSGLKLAGAATSSTCGTLGTQVQGSTNGSTWTTPAANHTWLRLTGGTLTGGSTCEITVPVTSATAGEFDNSTGVVSSSFGNTAASVASIVVMAPPTLAKAFTPNSIIVNESSVLTITLSNPNSLAVTGVALTDAYPSGLVNTATPNASTSCSGGALTAAAAGNNVVLSGASIPANSSCTINVQVTSATAGIYTNSTGVLTSSNAGNGAAATADLTVTPYLPALSLTKLISVISDPVNNTSNPKYIPGAVAAYSVRMTNAGLGSVDNNTLYVRDALPAQVALYVGVGANPTDLLQGFVFNSSTTPASGLACTFGARNNGSDCVDFSSDGVSFTYVPAPAADGFDANIKAIQFRPSGVFNPSGGGNPWAEFQFRVRVK